MPFFSSHPDLTRLPYYPSLALANILFTLLPSVPHLQIRSHTHVPLVAIYFLFVPRQHLPL